MTCIIAVRDTQNNVWLAGDKMSSDSYTHQIVKDPKIFKVGNLYIGYTTSFYMGQLLKYSFDPPEQPEDMSDDQYIYQVLRIALIQLFDDNDFGRKDRGSIECPEPSFGEFILVFKNRIFLVQDNMSFLEVDSAYAGSGFQVAQGAVAALMAHTDLSMQGILTTTMEIVNKNCVGVSKELDIIQCI